MRTISRPLVTLCAVAFVVACLTPLGIMFARIAAADFSELLRERTLSLLGRTLLLGISATTLALAIGTPFGFLIARTNLPGRAVLGPLGLVPLLMPPLMIAMTWTQVCDVRGALASILFLGAGTFPIVALFVARAAERIDARLEEAARVSGGPRALFAVDLALVLPAALTGAAFAFVFTVNDFSVPDYVSAVGPKFNVYADEIFASWKLASTPGRAIATSLPLIALTLLALLPVLVGRSRDRVSMLAGFRSPERLDLGRWKLPATLFVAAVVLLTAGVPLGRLVWEAGGGPRPPAGGQAGGWNLGNWHAAFQLALESRDKLANSLLFAVCAATLALPVALVLGHAIARTRSGKLWQLLVLLPIAVPATLFGIGTLVLWNHEATARFYDGGGIVVLLCAGRFLAFPVLVIAGAVSALDPRLEEAGAISGAGPARRLARLVAPPLWPTLVGSWILVFVLSLRELDATIFVPAANDTAMFKLYNAVHFGRDDFVAALALLIVLFLVLPGLLWTLFARRKLELLP